MADQNPNILLLRTLSWSFAKQALHLSSNPTHKQAFAPMLCNLCTCLDEVCDRAADRLEQAQGE